MTNNLKKNEIKEGHVEHRRTINVFVLVMLSLAVVISLRNLPLTAGYGFSAIFFYALATLFFMLPYGFISAELSSGWPKSGGVYIWVREALGERWGFFAIWMQWFHNMTWYPTMLSFVGAGLAYVFHPPLVQNKFYLLSVILIGFWGVTWLNFLGIRTSSWMSTLCVIIGVIIPGALLITLGASWVIRGMPISLHLTSSSLLPDLHSISNLVFLGGIFLSLSGLEANANIAREVKNPQKSFPRAIFIGAILTLAILVLGSLCISIVIPKEQISLVAGLFDAFSTFFKMYNLNWLVPFIGLMTVIGAMGELNAWAIAGAKGLFVTTEHGSLPPIFHKLNNKHAPTNLLIFQAILVTIASLLLLFMPNVNIFYWILSALSSQMYLLMYILLLVSGIVLRYTHPHVHRPYKLPFKNKLIWVAGVIGSLTCLFAIGVSLYPPYILGITNIWLYESFLIGGLLVSVLIPIIIYSMRKEHWKIQITDEIREEIHKSTH